MSTPTHVRVLRNAPVRTLWTNARTAMAAAIERAAWRTFERAPDRATQSRDAHRGVITVLADAIVCRVFDGALMDLGLYGWTPEAPLLLAELRHELLSGRSRRDWPDADLLQVVAAIEDLCGTLASDPAVQFAEQFSGRDAQQRLVALAHDMRSPLNAILMLVERLQQGQDGSINGMQHQHLSLVYSAAFGLNSMANDLMDVARGGARLLGEAPRTFSISSVLRSVRDMVQPVAVERRLSLRFSGPPDDIRVGQESALHRVLLNLTTNALKFTTVGSVTVEVQQALEADRLQFAVEDTGRGIPAAELERLAEQSQTGDAQPVSFSADGLGLAICRKLVAAMGGELLIESRVDHGTRFLFSLPLPRA